MCCSSRGNEVICICPHIQFCGLTADVIVDEITVPPSLLDENRSQNALVERLEPLGLVIKVLLRLLQRRHAFLALFVHALLCLDRASGCLFEIGPELLGDAL